MFDDDSGIGSALQFTGGDTAPWQYESDTSYTPSSSDRAAIFGNAGYDGSSSTSGYVPSSADKAALYGDEGYGEGMTGQQTGAYDKALDLTGSRTAADIFSKLFGSGTGSSGVLGGLGSLLGSKAGMAGLLALLNAMDRQKATGGGAAQAYAGPGKIPQRTIVQGKYGPIAQYAATGGLMHAYAGGGPVQMEDGGFVMTKKAVDGAGGPQGIRQLIPDARMIRGPGTGTSDSIPAVINSPKGQTPAALSNGEAYVPKDIVERLGGAKRMYDMMHKLQRRA
jgi:hypothetical protein